jgi:murein tripeptide amidase MpaA
MKSSVIILLTILLSASNGLGQDVSFQTRAEKSDYKSTSDYEDVFTFIDQLKKSSPFIRIEKLATSAEGREIPLLIIGNPLPLSPQDLVNDKRIVVYIQANIHAGEVEGKEATLMYARDLLKEKTPELLNDIILLICPLFNPDGNEPINPLNRTNQNGPVNGVGVRYNGQFLDLNRDAMKAESPEVRGVLNSVFNRWDPSVFMDCHTTNGSYHVEPVTFTWMVNPNGNNSLISYMRDKMMPEMSKTLSGKYKVENCFYGEFFDMMDPEKGWVLDASEPRYMSNYFGIRNRLGILNENYVYADFRSRVTGCYYLIHSLVDFTVANKSEIKNILKEADLKAVARGANPSISDSFAIEYKVRPAPERVTVRTYEADVVINENGRQSYIKSDRQKDVTIPYYIDYYPVRSVRFPYAYLITAKGPEITNLIKLHGVRVEKLQSESEIMVERFDIGQLKSAERLNQGHHTNTIEGNYVAESIIFPAGTIVVRTAQPLGNLIAYLLEPQSNDGMMTWNFFDRYLVPQWGTGYYPYPVYKVMDKVEMKTNPW